MKFKEIFNALFPSVRSYTNFWMFLVYFLVFIISAKENQINYMLISSLGSFYCLNEWSKEK